MDDRTTAGPGLALARARRFERWKARLADTPESLAEDARSGMETDQFHLVYQPRVACADDEVRVVEALLRWREATRGDMRPEVFVPSLVATSVMGPLGMWVLGQACAQAASWEQARPASAPAISVAVNLTPAEILEADFTAQVRAAIDAAGIPPSALQVEVDVRTDPPRDPTIVERLEELRRVGIAVTLDGTSPAIATEGLPLPCDSVNIGRRHVRTIDADPECARAIGAAVRYAHRHSVTVTAIGVERQAQADILVEVGCDQLQGFHLSEPVPPGDLGWVDDESSDGRLPPGPRPAGPERAPLSLSPETRDLPRRPTPQGRAPAPWAPRRGGLAQQVGPGRDTD